VTNKQLIRLVNPEAERFGVFIFANALRCERVAEQDSHKGQRLVLCGAGPSLRDGIGPAMDGHDGECWGINSALVWLWNQGHKVTHGFTVDQTLPMLEEWESAPPVEYLLATSVHPNLTDFLTAKGRQVTFFHNFVGMQPKGVEEFMYQRLFPGTCMVGGGLNSVNRALCLALWMGFDPIVILGADCALGPNDEMHADGGGPEVAGATALILEGEIDGRTWRTKTDMIVSAVDLVRMKRQFGDRLELVGDTLPNALMDKDDAFLNSLPHFTTTEEAEEMEAELTGQS